MESEIKYLSSYANWKILQNLREYDEALKYLQESQEIREKNHPAMRLHNF